MQLESRSRIMMNNIIINNEVINNKISKIASFMEEEYFIHLDTTHIVILLIRLSVVSIMEDGKNWTGDVSCISILYQTIMWI